MRDFDEAQLAAWHKMLVRASAGEGEGAPAAEATKGLGWESISELIVWAMRWALPHLRVSMSAPEGRPLAIMDLASGELPGGPAMQSYLGALSYASSGDYETACVAALQMRDDLRLEVLDIAITVMVIAARGGLSFRGL